MQHPRTIIDSSSHSVPFRNGRSSCNLETRSRVGPNLILAASSQYRKSRTYPSSIIDFSFWSYYLLWAGSVFMHEWQIPAQIRSVLINVLGHQSPSH